jgi:hypothetical protein
VDRIVRALESEQLPEKLAAPVVKKVKNPF